MKDFFVEIVKSLKELVFITLNEILCFIRNFKWPV